MKRALGRGEGSGDIARKRLRLVLIQDRSALTVERMQSMKNDLIEVISRYLDIDRDSIQVEVKRSGGQLMLVSNIRVNDTQGPTVQPGNETVPEAG